ncbi:MAG: acetyl-CoA C-acyltransferase [Hyphomonas sp.]|nr:acetyl-CoA C-acyltransferase [Hyphomonas sp.]
MADAFIVDAVRTPRGVGKVGKGALAHMHPQHLAATVLSQLRDRNKLDTETVDDIIWGTSSQRGLQGGDMGRMAALDAGYNVKASGVTLDRFCGSGITTVNLAAAQIMSGMEQCVIAGGCEMMSYTAASADPKSPPMMDAGNLRLRERHPQSQQGCCADAIATLEGIDRAAVDQLAVVSQERAARAIKEGRFNKSVVPVYNVDGTLALDHEEFPRPGTTMESLSGLKTVFNMFWNIPVDDKGTTYGGVLLASEGYMKKHNLKPRARIVATANMGDCPTLMLNAPVPAARKVLEKAGLTTDDIDVYEINEAFSVVAEKFIRDLKLNRDKVNINGGAMALGHPIGATGSILIGTALDELERSGGRYGLVTMCAAGGMAPAIIIERLDA